MAESVYSKNGVPIRLTDERWRHITEEHGELTDLRSEMMETVANPAEILPGITGNCLQSGRSNQENTWWSYTANPSRTVLSSRRFSPGGDTHCVEGNNYGRSSY
jgi:hypothetical protein